MLAQCIRFLTLCMFASLLQLQSLQAASGNDLPYAPAPADNPLKGFMPYMGGYKNFPHSMEWFYLPLRDLQNDFNRFDWKRLEDRLNEAAGRGHQAVFRIYLDYPDTDYGVPDFLMNVVKHSYSDNGNGKNHTSYSPDYENPALRRALANFIAALGKRYDGDPRIGFLTLGLLGFWGEWHTYPHEWSPSTKVQNEVLDAFEKAFHRTKLLMREPKQGTNSAKRRIGYHDDSFAYQTLPPTDWHFWSKIVSQGAAGNWKTEAIGGEVRPEVQPCLWDDAPCSPAGQDFASCVKTTHASWMLYQGVFENLSKKQHERAVAAARSMGYELTISSVKTATTTLQGALAATFRVRNTGAAPFYYDWKVRVGVLDAARNVVGEWDTDFRLTRVIPGEPDVVWNLKQENHALKPGRYILLVRAVNPLKGGKPLRFANVAQDRDLLGWLSAGDFEVHADSK